MSLLGGIAPYAKKGLKTVPRITQLYDEAFYSQNWEEVIRLKDETFKFLESLDTKKYLAVGYVNLGIAYHNLGDLIKDIECQKTACRIYKSIDERNGQAYCYANLGNVYRELELYDDAIELYNIAIGLCKKTKDRPLFDSAYNGKSHCEYMIKATSKMALDENGNKMRVKLHQTVNPLRKSRPYTAGKRLAIDPTKRDKVFISYSSKDFNIVNTISQELSSRNISTYLDVKNKPTDDSHSLQVGLSQGLAESYAMLVCLSKNYIESEWCRSEIISFLLQSILEGRGYSLPILVLDLDEQTPEKTIPFLFFGSLGVSLSQNLYAMPKVTPRSMYTIDEGYKIAEIFDEYHFDPNEASEFILKIPLKPLNENSCINQVAEQLVKLKAEWEEVNNSLSPSFSNIRDFNNIWDEQYAFQYPGRTKREKDAILTGIVSILPKSTVIPSFKDGKELWDFVFKHYKFETLASTVDISRILKSFRPIKDIGSYSKKIERYYEPTLLRILEGVARNERDICVFDRSATESTQYYRDLIKEVETGNRQLLPNVLRGHPLALIFGDAQRRNLCVPLQYTYYHYLLNNRQNEVVDAAVIAGLLITLDMWQDKMDDEKKLHNCILEPLSTTADIWGSYHPSRYNNEVIMEVFGKMNKSATLVKDYKGTGTKMLYPNDDEFSIIGHPMEPDNRELDWANAESENKQSKWNSLKRHFGSGK